MAQPKSLKHAVVETPVGKAVEVLIVRKGKEEKKPTTPAAPAAPKPAAPAATPTAGPPRIKGKDDPVYKNVQPGGLYIDVDGTVRTKKAGE